MDFMKIWEVVQVFPRYPWYQKLALLVSVPFALYVAYLMTAGRPPLILYKLLVTPGPLHLTPEGYMNVDVDVANVSEPPATIHDVEGIVWITASTVIQASRPLSRVINMRDGIRAHYYGFQESPLHKETGTNIIRWLIVPPQAGQRFFIRYQIISSETKRAAGGWQIVNENGRLRIIDSK
jgi:hypothetical protein